MNERDYLHQLAGCNDEIVGLRARAEAAEAELASVREERDALEKALAEAERTWPYGHTSARWRTEFQARAESAEARVAQLEAALRGLLPDAEAAKRYLPIGQFLLLAMECDEAHALLASQPLPSEGDREPMAWHQDHNGEWNEG